MYELIQPACLILMQKNYVNCEMGFNKTRAKNAINVNIVTNTPQITNDLLSPKI